MCKSNLPRVLGEYRKQTFDIRMMIECSPAHAGLKYRGGKRALINLVHGYRKAAMEGLNLEIVSRHSRNHTHTYTHTHIPTDTHRHTQTHTHTDTHTFSHVT
jgi:hypothetical protein